MPLLRVTRTHSQPEVDPSLKHKEKRRKISTEDSGTASTTTTDTKASTMTFDFSTLAKKNAALKGRRRFNADLNDISSYVQGSGVVGHGYRVSRFQAGEDEGAVELAVQAHPSREDVLAIGVLVSDTSDYPKSHTYFSHSLSDSDPPSYVDSLIAGITSDTYASKNLVELVEKVLKDLSKTGTGSSSANAITINDSGSEAGEGDTEPDDEFYDYDEENIYNSSSRLLPLFTSPNKFNRTKLQADFIDTLASSYRPGFIPMSTDGLGGDFIISVSIPVVRLAEMVEPRALRAWDRKLMKLVGREGGRPYHLVLLISGWRGVYPYPFSAGGEMKLKFKVGLSPSYKPSQENGKEACRNFGLIVNDAEDELEAEKERERLEKEAMGLLWDEDAEDMDTPFEIEEGEREEEVVEEDLGTFTPFSLSSSLESLLDGSFLKLVAIRKRWGLGWAGAEVLLGECERMQLGEEFVMKESGQAILAVDKEEGKVYQQGQGGLPFDPLIEILRQQKQGGGEDQINLPLTAFSFLIRRLMLCTRFCIVCHSRLSTNHPEALKPYVCESKLCSYQYFCLGMGPRLEYEITHNPATVDLLTSLAYSAAAEGVLEDPLPIGMGLRVQSVDPGRVVKPPTRSHVYGIMAGVPGIATSAATPSTGTGNGNPDENVANQLEKDSDGLVDFDELSVGEMRVAIVTLIDSLPAIEEIKKHLERKVKPGKSKPKLKEMDPNILPAAWLVLRWIVGSCTADLEEITSGEEHIKNTDASWRQFRFTVGAPDAEAKFKAAVQEAQTKSTNAQTFPSLFAWHGSPLRNWHSIIRHGLWFKEVAHGRAYGNGVYLAKEAQTSMSGYAQAGRSVWRKSRCVPNSCVALAEIVNLPQEFVSSNPHFVIKDTHWIVCRYLLVKGSVVTDDGRNNLKVRNTGNTTPPRTTPFVRLDPAHRTTLHNQAIEIPEPGFQLEQMLETLRIQAVEDDNDGDDQIVFDYNPSNDEKEGGKGKGKEVIEISDEDDDVFMVDGDGDIEMYDSDAPPPPKSTKSKSKSAPKPKPIIDDWVHNPEWVQNAVPMMLPAPTTANRGATAALQRELKAMLKEQDNCKSLKELGWYMPQEFIGDNLFQWIVEMHSFDESIPIAKDMKREKINSIIFEIRFPPDFPLSPPFFRIITPRFLPFIHGGGGHVTGGGSICMDLLTASGWLPSYSIPAIIMQIKLAISNLDPRPARLASNWTQNYGVSEALAGYKRAAATHQWQLPSGIDQLVR
ncbi:hypothetical protein VKT23_010249 [Stygiomarasmius scandens]|uniref:UBC core domain-containing protein n=1 Tax=Marasmiellus scandens TaxID=2682957 RepID=A0ABR1JEY0_9AGAR